MRHERGFEIADLKSQIWSIGFENLVSHPVIGRSGCRLQGREFFVKRAAESQAWCPQVMESEGDLSLRVNCQASYAGTCLRFPSG